MSMRRCGIGGVLVVGLAGPAVGVAQPPDGPSVRSYATIQEAIDRNPGQVLRVPPGDYPIDRPIVLNRDGNGLIGSGRIIQTDPAQPVIRVENASGVRLRDLTLTRPEGKRETEEPAVRVQNCRDALLDSLSILDNWTRGGAIELFECRSTQVRHCLVRDYQRVGIDDRTANPDLGYAFRCTIGTGIIVKASQGIRIEGNRVEEGRLVPTPELARAFGLGQYTKKLAQRGVLAGVADWERDATDNWCQATAILVSSPTATELVQVLGNQVVNTGQGLDIHADHVVVANNLIDDTLVGMKAMHGSRHVTIQGNQFRRSALWAIGLMPGSASFGPKPPSDKATPGATPESNTDGGSIISGNIISDFGLGHYAWVWGHPEASGFPLRFDHGQMPDDPPLSDVVVLGNLVTVPAGTTPRYEFAVLVEKGPGEPQGLHFVGNLFRAGTRGVANVDLAP